MPINQMVSRHRSAAMAKSRFIATILLLGSSLRVSNYRRRASGFLTSAALRGASIFKMMAALPASSAGAPDDPPPNIPEGHSLYTGLVRKVEGAALLGDEAAAGKITGGLA
jgi:hypothetical protein